MLIGLGNSNITSELLSTNLSDSFAYSKPILVIDSIGFSITIVSSGAPIGYIKLQASNDSVKTQEEVTESSWGEITGSQQSMALAGSYMWNYANAYYKWIRFVFVRVGGYGKIESLNITAKR